MNQSHFYVKINQYEKVGRAVKKYKVQKIISILIVLSFSLVFFVSNNRSQYNDILIMNYHGNELIGNEFSHIDGNNLIIQNENESRVLGFTTILEEGKYTIRINYTTDSDETSAMLWSNKSTSDGVVAGELISYIKLDKNKNTIEVPFELSKYVSDVSLYINFGGGILTINDVTVKSQGNYYNDQMLNNILISMIAMISLIILCFNKVQKWINENMMLFIIGICVLFFTCLPLLFSSLHGAPYQDLVYHLNRIEGLGDAIKLGQFPIRIHPTELNGYGQAEGVFYPELFLMVPAIFRSLGMSLVLSYKWFVMIVNLATIFISYFSFKNIFKSKIAGNIGMVLYSLATYRLSALYVRSAVGEYLAIIFIPLIVWGLIEVFYRDKKKWLLLPIGMTCLLQSHLITTELVAICCVIFALINYKKVLRKDILLVLIKSVFVFIFLNLWWLIPFVDFSLSGVGAFERNYGIEEPIVRNISQLFAFDYPLLAGNQMPFSIGFLLLVGLVLFVGISYKDNKFRKSFEFKLCIYCLSFGMVSLWMSTSYFPWESLYNISLIKQFASTLQFSWRLLTIASVCFTMITIVVIMKMIEYRPLYRKYVVILVSIISIIFGSKIIVGNITEVPVYADRHYQADINEPGYTLGGWYLPRGIDTFYVYYRPMVIQSSNENILIENYSREGNNIKFSFNNNQKDSYFEIPLIYYDCYYATLNGKQIDLNISENKLIRLDVKDSKEGYIEVKYKEKPLYIFGNGVSLISFMTIIVMLGIEKLRRK